MAYTPGAWVENVSVIHAADLARIETGIAAAATQTGADGAYVRHNDLAYNVKDYGATGDGVTDDTTAINAAITAAFNAGGGTVWMPPTVNGYAVSKSGTNWAIQLRRGVSLLGANTKIVLTGSAGCNVVVANSITSGMVTVTANTAVTDATLTVASTATLSAGQDVLFQGGQDPIDPGEPLYWLWAKILTVDSSTSVTLDRPVGYALDVTATTDARHKSLSPITELLDNFVVDGFNFIGNIGTGFISAALSTTMARNFRIGALSGKDVGAGLWTAQYCQDVSVSLLTVRRSPLLGGNAATGRGIDLAECRNVEIEHLEVSEFYGSAIYAEFRVENIRVQHLTTNDTAATKGASAVIEALYGAGISITNWLATGSNSTVLSKKTGTGVQSSSVDVTNLRTLMSGLPVIPDLSVHRSVMNLNGTIYSATKPVSQTFRLPASVSQTVSLPAGIYRNLKIYVSSLTGLTSMGVNNVTGGGGIASATLLPQLVAGQQVAIGGIGIGSGYAINGATDKQVFFSTDGTVPAGTYCIIEAEVWVPVNDTTKGLRDVFRDVVPLTTPPTVTGTTTNPSLLSALASLGLIVNSTSTATPAMAPDIQVFTTNGTWTKPAGATVVSVIALGGAGGGGSGRRGAAGTVRCGGGGGGAGGLTRIPTMPAASLGATVGVSVGAGGIGGVAVTTDSTDGNVGGNGGTSSFGNYARTTGGIGGAAGTAVAGPGGAAATTGAILGSAGGSASTTGGIGAASGGSLGAAGGGAGGGITSTDSPSAGGAGGLSFAHSPSGNGAGGAVNTAGGAATDTPVSGGLPGNGGGGGGASITGPAGAGGAGGIYAAAGGGGGASLNGNNSGAGGAGAAGICVVISV